MGELLRGLQPGELAAPGRLCGPCTAACEGLAREDRECSSWWNCIGCGEEVEIQLIDGECARKRKVLPVVRCGRGVPPASAHTRESVLSCSSVVFFMFIVSQ